MQSDLPKLLSIRAQTILILIRPCIAKSISVDFILILMTQPLKIIDYEIIGNQRVQLNITLFLDFKFLNPESKGNYLLYFVSFSDDRFGRIRIEELFFNIDIFGFRLSDFVNYSL